MSSSSPFNQEKGNTEPYLSKAQEEYKLLEASVAKHEKPKSGQAFSSSTDLEHLISGTPETLASLVAAKKESRINQSEKFCCFTLKNQNEFNLFLSTLSKNLDKLTDGTRFSVIAKNGCHWFPIDFYFKNKKLHTFLLDAYNYSVTLPDAKGKLESYFPKSKHCHYSFYAGIERKNALQKSGRGCRVFSSYHAFNMSKIPPEVMYRDLKEASKDGLIEIDSIKKDSSLLKLLRPSHSSLDTLTQEVMNSIIVRKKGNTTLKKSIVESSTVEQGRSKNITMNYKSDIYRKKVINYFDSHDEEQKIIMISQRDGMAYLFFPRLFDLDKLLSESDDKNAITLIRDFVSRLKNIDSLNHSKIINKNIDIIENLITNYEPRKKGLIVSATLQTIVSMRNGLTNANSIKILSQLDTCINNILLENQAISSQSCLNQTENEEEGIAEQSHNKSMNTPTWNFDIIDWIKRNPKKTVAIITGAVIGSLISGGILPLTVLGLGAGGFITSLVAGVTTGMLTSVMTGLSLYITSKIINCYKSQKISSGFFSYSTSSQTIFINNNGDDSQMGSGENLPFRPSYPLARPI